MSGPRTTSGPLRHAVFGVAAGGALLGHWLTYAMAGPHGDAAEVAMVHADHGYLGFANDLALTLALAGAAIVFLGRLTRGDESAPTRRATASRLAMFQIGAFGAMETLERLTAGAPMHDLTALIPAGIAVQGLLAVLGALVIAWLLRVAVSVESRFGAVPWLPRPATASVAVIWIDPRLHAAVAAAGIRGPPPAC